MACATQPFRRLGGLAGPWWRPEGFAPIAIGLALTLIHLISIPVTNTSVNPARSTGVLGALIYRSISGQETQVSLLDAAGPSGRSAA